MRVVARHRSVAVPSGGATMMAGGVALSSRGFSETKRRPHVIPGGFGDIRARFLHEFRCF